VPGRGGGPDTGPGRDDAGGVLDPPGRPGPAGDRGATEPACAPAVRDRPRRGAGRRDRHVRHPATAARLRTRRCRMTATMPTESHRLEAMILRTVGWQVDDLHVLEGAD